MSKDFHSKSVFKGKGYIVNKPKTYETFVDKETGEQHFVTCCRMRFSGQPNGRSYYIKARSEKAPDVAGLLRNKFRKNDILVVNGIVRLKKHIETDPETGDEYEVMREVVFLTSATVAGIFEPETPRRQTQDAQAAPDALAQPETPPEAPKESHDQPDNTVEPHDMGSAQPAPEADDDIPF